MNTKQGHQKTEIARNPNIGSGCHALIVIIIACFASAAVARSLVWELKGELPRPLRGTAVACHDKIYFMEANPNGSGVYQYDPSQNTWTKPSQMPTWGWNVNLAQWEGLIYVLGGDPFRDRNERYHPIGKTWETLAPMPTPRQHTNCCVVSGKIYVIGGLLKGTLQDGDPVEDWAAKTKLADQVEGYNPKTNQWQTMAPLPTPRQGPGIACLEGKVFAIGGAISNAYDSPASRRVEVFDVEENTWQRKADFPIPITAMGVVTVKDTLYVIGGQTQNPDGDDIPLASVYTYASDTDTWSRTTDLPNPIQVVSATVLDETIYVIGGCDQHFRPLKQVWCAQTNLKVNKP